MIRDFTSDELKLFADTIVLLERMDGTCDIRKEIFPNVIRLARADFAASYVWDPGARRFKDSLVHNMGKENIRHYEEWHQFRDPMTLKLRARRTATLVEEVTPYPMLHKTEFYNDFLRRDGLDHGINVFLFDRGRDLGDFRLWRAKSGAAFGEREVELLNTIAPFIERAIVRWQNWLPAAVATPTSRGCSKSGSLPSEPISTMPWKRTGGRTGRNWQRRSARACHDRSLEVFWVRAIAGPIINEGRWLPGFF